MEFRLKAQSLEGFRAVPRNQLLRGFLVGEHRFFVSQVPARRRGKARRRDRTTENENTGTKKTKYSVPLDRCAVEMATSSAQRIIAKFGGQTSLAKLIGRSQSTVQHWAKSGSIPAKWQQRILDIATERGISISRADFFAAVVQQE